MIPDGNGRSYCSALTLSRADGQLLDLMGNITPAVAEANSYGKLVEMLEAYFTRKV